MIHVVYHDKSGIWARLERLCTHLMCLWEWDDEIVYLPPPFEVSWEKFWNRLVAVDQRNVGEFCAHIADLSQKIGQSITIMAVGSVLNGKPGAYHDVDLLLLPTHFASSRLEDILADFITSQPNILRESTGEPCEDTWHSLHLYDCCRHWHLSYKDGKTINVFIYTSHQYHRTLEEKRIQEASYCSFFKRKFAYKTFDP